MRLADPKRPGVYVQFRDRHTKKTQSITVDDATPEQLRKLLEVAIEGQSRATPKQSSPAPTKG